MEWKKHLSVIIPSYKDPLMVKTVNSLLESSELADDLEVIVVLDGYWPNFEITEDKRVRYLHLGKNRGMRGAINAGVDMARGKYIMRTDEHCMFGKGYDRILTRQCRGNWIVTARRYFLDPVKWEIMTDLEPVDCEKLVIQSGVKFSGQRWTERAEQLKDSSLIESQAMQGSMWLMKRKWWDKVIKELDTNPNHYGPHYQDSHEMVFKTYKEGGKLMVNKNTWFAHKHRSFPRTHNDGTSENPANKESGWKYSLDTWKDYYQNEFLNVWGK